MLSISHEDAIRTPAASFNDRRGHGSDRHVRDRLRLASASRSDGRRPADPCAPPAGILSAPTPRIHGGPGVRIGALAPADHVALNSDSPLDTARLTSRRSGPGPPPRFICYQGPVRRAGTLGFRRSGYDLPAAAGPGRLGADRSGHGGSSRVCSTGAEAFSSASVVDPVPEIIRCPGLAHTSRRRSPASTTRCARRRMWWRGGSGPGGGGPWRTSVTSW